MLSQNDLTAALHDALKACAPPCGCFCSAGAEVTDDKQYLIFHNGAGPRHTSVQRVYRPKALELSREQLAVALTAWVNGVHRGNPVDLNAGA